MILVYILVQPEMEMVARGLEKNLKLEQREYLLKMITGVSSEENRRSLVEALGLVCLLASMSTVVCISLSRISTTFD